MSRHTINFDGNYISSLHSKVLIMQHLIASQLIKASVKLFAIVFAIDIEIKTSLSTSFYSSSR